VLVNGTGPMASLVRGYEAGVVLDDHEDLGSALRAFELLDETAVRDNARRLFTKELDLARTSAELLAALNV